MIDIDDMLTIDFLDQVLYNRSMREAMIGIDPRESVLIHELRQYRYHLIGERFSENSARMARAAALKELIEANHARVKTLASMVGNSEHTEQEIAEYIIDLYNDAEEAIQQIGEL